MIAYGGTLSKTTAKVGETSTISSAQTGYSTTNTGISCSSGTSASISGTTITINSVGASATCKVVLSKIFDYTGAEQTYSIPVTGSYKLQVWGAQGGSGASTKVGGLGGYSSGIINLNASNSVYAYVGGKGTNDPDQTSSAVVPGGFNGGGYGRSWSGTTHDGAGGGGATDIRIGSNTLYARVIVAGAGGGASDNGVGGYGGGLTSGGGASSLTTATQTTGYSFGIGMDTTYTSGEVGGGGGGWYGGYAGTAENIPGSGGSGYLYTSSTASNYPSGCLLNSSHYLTLATAYTCDGAGNCKNVSSSAYGTFYSTSGSTETGHSGNGYAIISFIG